MYRIIYQLDLMLVKKLGKEFTYMIYLLYY